jgi:hypothetical protein
MDAVHSDQLPGQTLAAGEKIVGDDAVGLGC